METASLQLPKDMIEAAIKQQVSVAIATALKGHEAIIDRAVNAVLSAKVDRNGGKDAYGSGQPFIEWLCKDAIEKVVREVCVEEIEKIKPQVRESIVSYLAKKNSPLTKRLAEAMVDGVSQVLGSQYRSTVNINFESR